LFWPRLPSDGLPARLASCFGAASKVIDKEFTKLTLTEEGGWVRIYFLLATHLQLDSWRKLGAETMVKNRGVPAEVFAGRIVTMPRRDEWANENGKSEFVGKF
jgi:hypothetical protein